MVRSQNLTLIAILSYTLVGVLIYLLSPKVMQLFSSHKLTQKKLLLAAVIILVLSLFLPSPLIDGKNTQFSTHFVGGGIFSGLIWLFLVKNLRWKPSPMLEITSLYFLVSGLGVANELFELLTTQLGILHIQSFDTWWDLLANTLGALFFWVIYRLLKR